jgi:hypothetical protein
MSKRDEVEARYRKELAAAEIEDAITAVVPAGARVHVHPLYGTVACVRYGDPYAYGKHLEWAELVDLVRALPPVDATMTRGSTTAIMPDAYAASLPDSRVESETAIAPITLRIEGNNGPTVAVHWFATTPAGMVRVEVHLGYLSSGIGRYNTRRVEYRGGYRYEPAKLTLADGIYSIHADDGEPVAEAQQPIRWWAPETSPQDMTVYFVALTEDPDPAVLGMQIVTQLAKMAVSR